MSEPVILDGGRIRLYQGDCLEILPTLEPGSVDTVVTDPPYLIGAASIGNSRAKSGTWADLNNATYWFSAWYRECWRFLDGHGHFATFCNWRTQPLVLCAMAQAGMTATSCLIWNKEWIGPAAPNALRPTYEMIVIASGERAAIADRGLSDIWAHQWMAGHNTESDHPAAKPVGLLVKLISALGGKRILDPFLGGGSTLAACARLGLSGTGVEIDGQHFAVARRRIEEELRLRDGRGPLMQPADKALFPEPPQ